MASTMEYIISGGLTAIGAGVFFYGFNRMHKYKLIKDTPQSKIRSIAMGLVEIHGNVKGDKLIKTPFSQRDCVFYRYKIEEYAETVSTDSKGNKKVSRSWRDVGNGEKRVPFYATDETGEIYVDPNGAEVSVEPKAAFTQRSGAFNDFGSILNVLRNWDNLQQAVVDKQRWGLTPIDPKTRRVLNPRIGDRRYTEWFISPEEQLFVLGTAVNKQSAPNGTLIQKGENEPTFMIADKSEKSMLSSLKWTMIACFLFGGLMILSGVYLILMFTGVVK